MGVRRLFSRGGQNFPGGAKTYYLPLKHLKTYFGRPGGGKGPLLPSPADAHDIEYSASNNRLVIVLNHDVTGLKKKLALFGCFKFFYFIGEICVANS